MDIVTVTYNPCVDVTNWVKEFGQSPFRTEEQTGGKGVNCARVIGNLGLEAAAVCPVSGKSGLEFEALAKAEGISLEKVICSAPTRIITTWVRERDLAQRVDYQKGAPLSVNVLAEIEKRALEKCSEGARILAVCGSVPDEMSAEAARELLIKAKKAGIKTVLDSNGIGLTAAAEALPDLIKPNEDELYYLTGERDISKAASALIDKGVGAVLVSLGARGCMFASRGIEEYRPGFSVKAVNAVGSGDSFLAAFLCSSVNGASIGEACDYANAAGAANAMMFPAARVDEDMIARVMGSRSNFGAY